MIVGYMGEIPFLASKNIVRTIDNFSRSGEGRWAKHDIIGQKPVLEFIGPDLEEISFKILLRQDLGVSPLDEIKKLFAMRDAGTAFTLVLGNKTVGDNMWIIKSVSYDVSYWNKYGTPLSAEASLTLQEYVKNYEEEEVTTS